MVKHMSLSLTRGTGKGDDYYDYLTFLTCQPVLWLSNFIKTEKDEKYYGNS